MSLEKIENTFMPLIPFHDEFLNYFLEILLCMALRVCTHNFYLLKNSSIFIERNGKKYQPKGGLGSQKKELCQLFAQFTCFVLRLSLSGLVCTFLRQ